VNYPNLPQGYFVILPINYFWKAGLAWKIAMMSNLEHHLS